MKPELKIHVNLTVPYGKKIPFSTAERTKFEDGVTTIRPWRNDVPGGTEKEVQEAYDQVKNLMDAKWQSDGNGGWTGNLIDPITYEMRQEKSRLEKLEDIIGVIDLDHMEPGY